MPSEQPMMGIVSVLAHREGGGGPLTRANGVSHARTPTTRG
jgi:hypothetical protein